MLLSLTAHHALRCVNPHREAPPPRLISTLSPPCCRAPQAWSLLSIFVSTILGLVLDPLPVGAWAFIAVTVAVATKTLTFAEAFAATNNEIIWLIVVSFFFAKVGLGVGTVGTQGVGVVGWCRGRLWAVGECCMGWALMAGRCRRGGAA